jgi:hypothetical protein
MHGIVCTSILLTVMILCRPDGMGGTINVCVAQPPQDISKRKSVGANDTNHAKRSKQAHDTKKDNKASIVNFFGRP